MLSRRPEWVSNALLSKIGTDNMLHYGNGRLASSDPFVLCAYLCFANSTRNDVGVLWVANLIAEAYPESVSGQNVSVHVNIGPLLVILNARRRLQGTGSSNALAVPIDTPKLEALARFVAANVLLAQSRGNAIANMLVAIDTDAEARASLRGMWEATFDILPEKLNEVQHHGFLTLPLPSKVVSAALAGLRPDPAVVSPAAAEAGVELSLAAVLEAGHHSAERAVDMSRLVPAAGGSDIAVVVVQQERLMPTKRGATVEDDESGEAQLTRVVRPRQATPEAPTPTVGTVRASPQHHQLHEATVAAAAAAVTAQPSAVKWRDDIWQIIDENAEKALHDDRPLIDSGISLRCVVCQESQVLVPSHPLYASAYADIMSVFSVMEDPAHLHEVVDSVRRRSFSRTFFGQLVQSDSLAQLVNGASGKLPPGGPATQLPPDTLVLFLSAVTRQMLMKARAADDVERQRAVEPVLAYWDTDKANYYNLHLAMHASCGNDGENITTSVRRRNAAFEERLVPLQVAGGLRAPTSLPPIAVDGGELVEGPSDIKVVSTASMAVMAPSLGTLNRQLRWTDRYVGPYRFKKYALVQWPTYGVPGNVITRSTGPNPWVFEGYGYGVVLDYVPVPLDERRQAGPPMQLLVYAVSPMKPHGEYDVPNMYMVRLYADQVLPVTAVADEASMSTTSDAIWEQKRDQGTRISTTMADDIRSAIIRAMERESQRPSSMVTQYGGHTGSAVSSATRNRAEVVAKPTGETPNMARAAADFGLELLNRRARPFSDLEILMRCAWASVLADVNAEYGDALRFKRVLQPGQVAAPGKDKFVVPRVILGAYAAHVGVRLLYSGTIGNVMWANFVTTIGGAEAFNALVRKGAARRGREPVTWDIGSEDEWSSANDKWSMGNDPYGVLSGADRWIDTAFGDDATYVMKKENLAFYKYYARMDIAGDLTLGGDMGPPAQPPPGRGTGDMYVGESSGTRKLVPVDVQPALRNGLRLPEVYFVGDHAPRAHVVQQAQRATSSATPATLAATTPPKYEQLMTELASTVLFMFRQGGQTFYAVVDDGALRSLITMSAQQLQAADVALLTTVGSEGLWQVVDESGVARAAARDGDVDQLSPGDPRLRGATPAVKALFFKLRRFEMNDALGFRFADSVMAYVRQELADQ